MCLACAQQVNDPLSPVIIGKMNNRVIEVEQIRLVVGLELVKEVKDFECEDGVWSNQRGREPFPPEQLPAAIGGILRSTHAVPNNNLMDTAEIENGDLVTPRWIWTLLASSVTQLHHEAKGSEGFGGKVLSVPSLQEGR